MQPKILIVEDEKNIAKALKYNFEKAGYAVYCAVDGQAGLELHDEQKPDIVILDIMLPKFDGLEVCKRIRQKAATPIIMLTAKKEEIDRIIGLELGADDYVSKPFSIRELMARVKAVLRRHTPGNVSEIFKAGTLEADLERYEVRVAGKPVNLSSKEFSFLKCLILADGKALNREQFLEKIWGYDKSMEIDTNTVDQHVARLRAKLGSEAARIITVKNVGYRIKTD